MPHTLPDSMPRFQQVKQYLLDRLERGELKPGDRIPSEHEFGKLLDISRMTVNRALREMTDAGYLERVAGVGTFVSEVRAQSHLVEVRNIAEEVRSRHHEFTTELLRQEKIVADETVSDALGLRPEDDVFHSIHIHYENGIPIQLEDRYVNPAVFPHYSEADLTEHTPNEYLMKEAVMERAEHTVSAIGSDPFLCEKLALEDGEACLLLERRTWALGKRASYVRLYHPGSRYQLKDEFKA